MKRLPSPNGAKCESPGQRSGYQVLKDEEASHPLLSLTWRMIESSQSVSLWK